MLEYWNAGKRQILAFGGARVCVPRTRRRSSLPREPSSNIPVFQLSIIPFQVIPWFIPALLSAGLPLLMALCLFAGSVLPARVFAQQEGCASDNCANATTKEGLLKSVLLPDTGQTNHYTQTFGEDSDFNGRAPSYTDNGDGTVTDQVTGLTWQKTDGGEMTWERAKEYARNLKLGGHQDGRLPSSMELFSILDHGKHGPALSTESFTRTEARYWWTDSPRVDDASRVWLVNSGGGIGAHAKRETKSAGGERLVHVRCVRGVSVFGTGPLLHDNGDGTVTDQHTGLIWQNLGTDRGMTWEEALKYCDSLKLAVQDDWLLPNIKELRSLSDDRKVQQSLDKAYFSGAQAAGYWSSTSLCNRPQQAWFVDFETGLVSHADKSQQHIVLAVRGGVIMPYSKVKSPPDPKHFEGVRNAGGNKGKGDSPRSGNRDNRPLRDDPREK